MEADPLLLRPDEVETLFPFRIGFDARGWVRELGPALEKLAPELLEGAHFGSEILLVRPDLPGRIWIDLAERAGPKQVLVVRLVKQELLLRGVLLPHPDEPNAANFFGAPALRSVCDLEEAGLSLGDLDPTSPLGPLLVQAETREREERELRRRAAFVAQRCATLEARLEQHTTGRQDRARLTEQLLRRARDLARDEAGASTTLYDMVHDLHRLSCIEVPGTPLRLAEFHPAELCDALLHRLHGLGREVEFDVDTGFDRRVFAPFELLEHALGTLLELATDAEGSYRCVLRPADGKAAAVGLHLSLADAEGRIQPWVRSELSRPGWRRGKSFSGATAEARARLAVAQELLGDLGAGFVRLRGATEAQDLELELPWLRGEALRDQLESGFPERVLLVGPLDHAGLAGLQNQLEALRARVRRVGTPAEALAELAAQSGEGAYDALLAPVEEGRAAWRSRFRKLLMAAPRPLPRLVGLSLVEGRSPGSAGELLTLPVPDLELVRRLALQVPAPPPPARARRPRVLLLEPDAVTRRLSRALLERSGAEVDVADSVKDTLRRHRARSYDVILVDLDEPRGNRLGLLRDLRSDQEDQDRPTLLAFSERGDPEQQIALLLTGADGIVQKPLRVRRDARSLADWLHPAT